MNDAAFRVLPPAASTAARRFDLLFGFEFGLMCLVSLAVFTVLVVFAVRYRKGSPADRSNPPTRGRALEITWTVTPLIVFLGLFVWAAWDFAILYRSPPEAMPVFVVAKQWMWTVEHRNGRREISELHVPAGQPVRLVMASQDVIHSFFVPAFRVKQDVVPGRYTQLAFTPTKAGEYHLLCAEYCGTEHSVMGGHIVVMPPAEFAKWLQAGSAQPGIAQRGFDLFRSHGCSGCHATGSSVHAPDLNGILGRTVHLADGRALVADENYLRDSMLLPRKDVVAGYEPVMPSFAGQLNEEDLMAIIEYLRSTGQGETHGR